MRFYKRLLGVVLALSMLLTLLPVSAFAAEDMLIDPSDAFSVLADGERDAEESEISNTDADAPEKLVVSEEVADIGELPISEEPVISEDTSNLKEPSEAETVSFPEGAIGCGGDDIPHSAPYAPAEDNSIDPDQLAAMCPVPYAEGETVRYSVLVLDTSATSDFLDENGRVFYTADTAIEYVRESAKKFVSDVRKADGINYVAVVEYKGTMSNIVSGFTTDYDTLNNAIDGLYSSSVTRSVAYGLQKVNSLLDAIPDPNAIKNVVLFTTGMTNEGPYSYSGRYDENTVASNWRRMDTQVRLYAYSNSAVAEAEKLKEKATLYTVGLFQVMEDMPQAGSEIVEFFKLFTRDMATSEDYFYDVKDPSQLEFVFGEIADDINTGNKTMKEIEFMYQSGRDYTAKCYYTDTYFSGSSYAYKKSLATMSLSLAMSAFGSGDEPDYANKSKNAKNLLMEIGCEEDSIQVNNWFTVKPTTDSIGAIYGNKEIEANGKKYTLVVVAVRGGGYEQEWASNFTIGLTGQHNGFNEAKNNVLNYLIQYISDQNITGDIKLWITGYSRAAATANLLGGEIVRNADLGGAILGNEVQYEKGDIYTYCFETPAGALTNNVANNSIYYNIFNIINSSDPVPYVAPAVMGFGRYGKDRYLPSKEADPTNYSSKLSDMLDVYGSLDSTGEYVVDNFQMKKIELKYLLPGGKSPVQDNTENNFSQGVFLSNYVTYLGRDFIKNRPNYVANYQDEIREILSVMFGCTDKQQKKLMDSLVDQAKNEWGSLLGSYIWNTGFNPWGSEEDALQIVSDWLKKAVKDAGITDYNDAVINSAGIRLADLLLALIANHPNYATTLGYNISGIGAAHYPELCYSWLASMDPNYKPGAVEAFNNGSYRIIRINCDVDAKIFNEDNTLVASITNESPDDVSSIISGINEDGEKFFVLPVMEDYSIEIKARSNTTVNYGIDEYSALSGDFTRAVDYFDVALNEGESLSGAIPRYTAAELENDTPNGSTVNYTLTMPDGTERTPDSDLDGSEVGAAYSNISAVSENTAYGVVTGSGLRQNGNFAQVEAAANDGYSFIGWYTDGKLVSTDTEYRFRVSEDITLTARFSPISNPNPTPSYGDSTSSGSSYTPTTYRIEIEKTEHGKVVSSRTNASSGSTVTLTVTPDSNYALDTLNVTDSKGNELKLVDSGNGKYTFTMPASKITISATFVELSDPSTATTMPVTVNFTDVPSGAYYYDAVAWAVEKGITAGTTATTFSPNDPCTRAQIVTFLWRAAGSPVIGGSSPFTDVAPGSYYYDAVAWAVAKGITAGTSATTFSPNDTCTRGQAVTFLYRAAGSPAASGDNTFTDVAGNAYYSGAVQWAVDKGVTAGTSATTFSPNDNCTRAQIVTFLYRDRAN